MFDGTFFGLTASFLTSSRRLVVSSLTLGLCLTLVSSALAFSELDEQGEQETTARIGQKVADFELQDVYGKPHRLSDFSESPVIVLVFSGTECPLAKLYAPTLVEMEKAYRDQQVTFLMLNSNAQDSLLDLTASVRRDEIEFPVLKDAGNRVADQVGATRTPEVFVLDQERIIRYQGRIDDRYGIGSVRPEAATNFLTRAIDAVLAGDAPQIAYEPAVGCLIGKAREKNSESDVTYANQISRILNKRCVECHRAGEIGPFALVDYEEVSGWAEMIAEVVEEERMPPWHASPEHGSFANDRRMSDEEKKLIYTWVENGAPLGNPNDLPPTPEFVTGWQLPKEPDLIVPITKEPVQVPAQGVVDYQYFEVDPGFEEEKWLKATQLLPGNRAVVHHILVFAKPPGGSLRSIGGGAKGFLAGYVPGVRSEPFPEGMAKRIPAGSTLIFQMHYTPVGTPQEDVSEFGLVFADPEEVTHEVVTTSSVQPGLKIPPGADNHPETAVSHMWLDDYQLLAMMPHMHLRGKAFRYELAYPDGTRKTLLDVPQYDFNWQTAYRLREPISLPPGSRMYCVARYDNSEENPYNPDPTREVGWGEQTWDEMMIGYFDVAIPMDKAEERQRLLRKLEKDPALMRAHQFVNSNDTDGDRKLSLKEVPQRLRLLASRLDADGDKHLTAEEIKQVWKRR